MAGPLVHASYVVFTFAPTCLEHLPICMILEVPIVRIVSSCPATHPNSMVARSWKRIEHCVDQRNLPGSPMCRQRQRRRKEIWSFGDGIQRSQSAQTRADNCLVQVRNVQIEFLANIGSDHVGDLFEVIVTLQILKGDFIVGFVSGDPILEWILRSQVKDSPPWICLAPTVKDTNDGRGSNSHSFADPDRRLSHPPRCTVSGRGRVKNILSVMSNKQVLCGPVWSPVINKASVEIHSINGS